jgi:poly-gamma-glutamate synthesis protein (capsule biosynthesis protein)
MNNSRLAWCFAIALIGAAVVGPHSVHAPLPNALTAVFVGDIMLDRAVAIHARAAGDSVLFAGVRSLFKGRDLVVGNLEGTLTTNPSISQASSSILRFTFDPKYAAVLKGAGFDALSLANNHSLDFGASGYEQTVSYLTAQGITPFGSPLNDKNISVQMPIKGKNFCLVGYHGLYDPNPASAIRAIKDTRSACAYTVLVAHWGVEYVHEPTQEQRDMAHAFIDAGADVVIGAHPHVVEPLEIYNNKAVFYSLGNFVFDQGWMPQVRRGLAVGIEFAGNTTRFTLAGIDTFKEAAVAGATTTQAILADVVTPGLPKDIAKSILRKGEFELAK